MGFLFEILTGIILSAFICFVVMSIGRRGLRSRPNKAFGKRKINYITDENTKLQRDWRKGHKQLKQIICQLSNPGVRKAAGRILKIEQNILEFLQAHKEEVPGTRSFFTTYQNQTVSLVKDYLDLERAHIHTHKIHKMQMQILVCLKNIQAIYENEYNCLFNKELQNIQVNVTVTEQIIKENRNGL